MGKKYDWVKLKSEFVSGAWISLSKFFRDKGIINNSYTRGKTGGWLQERIAYQKSILTQAQEKLVESEINIRLRQQKASLLLQRKGIEKLKDLSINTVDEARKLITDGLVQEREALGIGEKKTISATEINISTGKTRLDEQIEKMNYYEILELIAELKKLKD